MTSFPSADGRTRGGRGIRGRRAGGAPELCTDTQDFNNGKSGLCRAAVIGCDSISPGDPWDVFLVGCRPHSTPGEIEKVTDDDGRFTQPSGAVLFPTILSRRASTGHGPRYDRGPHPPDVRGWDVDPRLQTPGQRPPAPRANLPSLQERLETHKISAFRGRLEDLAGWQVVGPGRPSSQLLETKGLRPLAERKREAWSA